MTRTKTGWKIVEMLQQPNIDCSAHFKADKIVMGEIAKVRKARHAKYNINYHLVWIPKARAKVMNRPFSGDIEKAIKIKCKSREWKLLAIQVMPDHVHLFVSAPPKWAPAKIVQELKGFTSWMMRRKYATLRKYREKELWAPSYYCGTAGHVSQEQVARYIEEQTRGHQTEKANNQTTLCRYAA